MEGRRGRRELWLCNFVGSKQIREARAMWAALWLWIYTTKRGKRGSRVMTNSKEGAGEKGGRVLRHRQLNFDNIKPTFSFDMSAKPEENCSLAPMLSVLCLVPNPIERADIKNCFSFPFVRSVFICLRFFYLLGLLPNRERESIVEEGPRVLVPFRRGPFGVHR